MTRAANASPDPHPVMVTIAGCIDRYRVWIPLARETARPCLIEARAVDELVDLAALP